MESLRQIIQKDVFQNETVVDENLIKEYYERNERKKSDEKWLKEHKVAVFKGLQELGKQKAAFGDLQVSYTVPDQSYFDEAKVLEFALEHGVYELVTKAVLDEDALTSMIEQGLIDFDELKEYAWVEKKGTERISVKRVAKE